MNNDIASAIADQLVGAAKDLANRLGDEVSTLRAENARLARERDEEWRQIRIADRCPSCGFTTLFVGGGGWLTCSNLACAEPGVTRSVEATKAENARLTTERDNAIHRADRAEAEVERLKREGTPGVLHEVDSAFHARTVAQRDAAWTEVERLKAALRDWQLGEGDTEMEAENAQLHTRLNRVLRAASVAMDLLESDATPEDRQAAFEGLQACFEGTGPDPIEAENTHLRNAPGERGKRPQRRILVIDTPAHDARATIIEALLGKKCGAK